MAEQEQFTKDQIVYSRTGLVAKYVVGSDGQHIVMPQYTGDDGEWFEGLETWGRVFSVAPVHVVEEQYAAVLTRKQAAEDELRELGLKASTLRSEVRDIERAADERMKRLKQHKGLEQLDIFLSGGISHYVIVKGVSVTIAKPEACISGDEEQGRYNDRDTKLLTLFGGSGGDLSWKLNRYSDGSGNYWSDCYPCTSLEQAQELAREKMTAIMDGWKKMNVWNLEELAKAAFVADVSVPPEIYQAIASYKRKRAQDSVDEHRRKLEAAEKELAAIPAVTA